MKLLYNILLTNSESSDIFQLMYNSHRFICILLIRDYGCTLFFSSLGDRSRTIAIDILDDFSPPDRLGHSEYLFLAHELGFTGASGNIFIPKLFFEEFDKHIPTQPTRKATNQEITRFIGKATTIVEGDKKYFCGWRNNGLSGNVTDKNYLKTRKLVGESHANLLRLSNISSCWTVKESEEDITKINDYLTLINKQS